MASPLPPLALAYHGLADVPLSRDRHGLFVRPADVLRQAGRLRSWGYRLSTFGELADRVRAGDGQGRAALTFDDGLGDNLRLLELGVPATVFVVTGWIGSTHPDAPGARMLTEDGVRALHAAGIEIGAHTVTHPDLTRLTRSEAAHELGDSRQRLEELVGAPVTVAAYPYGRANEETFAACEEAGFVAACRSSGHGSWSAPLNLPRQDMTNGCGLFSLRLKRDGRYEPLMAHFPARVVRRLMRHGRGLVR